MDRYICSLSAELLSEAVNELNEPQDDETRLAAIDSLKNAFKKENPNIVLSKEDDNFLLKFLRARKFQEADALELLKTFHVQKNHWPQVFEKVKKSKEVDQVLTSGVVGPIGGRAKNGSAVVMTRYGKGQSRLLDGIALSYLTIDLLSDKEENQIKGLTLIHDLAYATPRLIWQFELRLIKRWLKLLNNGIPITLKNVIYVHQPLIFSAVFNIINSLTDISEREKVVIVGRNYWRLYEFVDQSFLPPSFDGNGLQLDQEGWKIEILKKIEDDYTGLVDNPSVNTMCRLVK